MVMLALSPGGLKPKQEPPDFQPVRVLDIELSEPLPDISALDTATQRSYQRAQVLVRLHTLPMGVIDLYLGEDGLSADEFAPQIWQVFHLAINDHLRRDGLPEVSQLGSAGLSFVAIPACIQERTRFLAKAPPVCIIVPTRERTVFLEKCLNSLVALEYPQFEIVVVDNAPKTSATADLIRKQYGHLPYMRYVCEDRPGSQWARNSGLRYAHSDIVAFTDDDAQVDRYWLAQLVKAFQVAENVACVTGAALPAELETQAQAWFEQFAGFNKGRDFSQLVLNMTTRRLSDPLYPYIASKFGAGVNMAFRTSVLRAMGGFDPVFFNGQDIEAFFRIIANGYTLVYEPVALVRHFHRREYVQLRRQLYVYGSSFTAFLSKCIADDPKRALDLMARLPYALHYLLSPKSARNRQKRSSYPRELTWLELLGMLYGPFRYLHHRRLAQQIINRFGPLEVCASGTVTESPSFTVTEDSS